MRAERRAAVQEVLDQLAERDARKAATVKALRTEAGMTQKELAARPGIDSTYVSRIERGAANLTWVALGRLSAGLGMPRSAVVRRVEDAERRR